jgi:hypothetical protein
MVLFENLLMQGTSSVKSITALIVAISTAVGTIGALVVAIASWIKLSSHYKEIQNAADTAVSVGKMATAFGQKTAEQQDEIKTVVEAITSFSPDAKKMLDDKQKDIKYWTERRRAAEVHMKKNELEREELRK